MATMTIFLPGPMNSWAEARAARSRYSNASDHVGDLIRRDQQRKDKIAHMQRARR